MPVGGSTVVRRQLGSRLRRLREEAGKRPADVVGAKLMSEAKLWRCETGKTSIKIGDVLALCRLYGTDPETTNTLATLALGTTTQGWWEDYGTPGWFGLYMGLETDATEVRIYDPELVHGLLQTPAYTRALHDAASEPLPADYIEQQVTLRGKRQLALTARTPHLRLTAVLGAGVGERQVGGRDVMDEQLAHLRRMDQLDNVDVRWLTWGVGAHAAMHTGGFTILDFADEADPAVVYLESHTGARYLEKSEEVDAYRKIFELICRQATPIKECQP